MIQIDKNVPLPLPRSKLKDYPFEQMQIGDSFFDKDEDKKLRNLVTYAASKMNMKFATRKELDGLRVWRTE